MSNSTRGSLDCAKLGCTKTDMPRIASEQAVSFMKSSHERISLRSRQNKAVSGAKLIVCSVDFQTQPLFRSRHIPLPPRLHEHPKHIVHKGLVAPAAGLEPFQHIVVDAD